MEFANKWVAQWTEALRTMAPATRIVAALAMAVLLGAGAWLVSEQVGRKETFLLGSQAFSIEEITAMQAALGKAQLNDFTVDGNRIRIPADRQAAYLAALADGNALPASFTDILSAATDKTSWLTNHEQQVDYRNTGKKKALAQVIRSMNGVESAEVDFDQQLTQGLRQERKATALVAVRMRGGQPLDEDRVPHFQRVVAAAIAGFAPDDVTVVDKNTQITYGGHATKSAGALDDPYRDRKRTYQRDYEDTVRRALAYVPGVQVSADVELETRLQKQGAADADVPESRRAVRDTPVRNAATMQGGANQPANLTAAVIRDSFTGTPAIVSRTSSGPEEHPTAEFACLTPKSVAISIGVPESYFKYICRRRHSAAFRGGEEPGEAEIAQVQTEEIARIRQHVATLIAHTNVTPGGEPLVTVTPFPEVMLSEKTVSAPGDVAVLWIASHAQKLLIVAGVLAALWIVHRAIARARKARRDDSRMAADTAAATATSAPSAAAKARFQERRAAARTLREDLAEMVREDPDVAANVLRGWIGNPS